MTRGELLKKAKGVTGWRVVHEDALVELAKSWGVEIEPDRHRLPSRLEVASDGAVSWPGGPILAVSTETGLPVIKEAVAAYNRERATAPPGWKVTFFADIHKAQTVVYTEDRNDATLIVRREYPGCTISEVVPA